MRQSLEWKYLQTPQFTISTEEQVEGVNMELTVRYGAITSGSIAFNDGASISTLELPGAVIGLKLHEVSSWEDDFCSPLEGLGPAEKTNLAKWLHKMLPVTP